MTLLRFASLLGALCLWHNVLAESILIVATSPVPTGKFRTVVDAARQHGLSVEAHFAERLSAEQAAKLLEKRDLIIFDAARSHMQDAVKGKLGKALEQLKTPHIWMKDDGPGGTGLPADVAARLHAYYTNGGRSNYDGFFATLAAQLRGQPLPRVAAPFVFPEEAIYHPKAPHRVFATPAEYFRWRGIAPEKRPPTVAIAFHQIYIGAEQTTFIDDMVARVEAGGAIALPYYAGVMGPHRKMLTVDGKPVADAVINTQIILDPEGRRKELAELGIPVIQALAYRKGDEAAWRADPQGVPLIDVPFYLAQGEYAGIVDAIVANTSDKASGDVVVLPGQTAAIVNKALRLVRLQRLQNADKKVAMLFWNYPPGEKNLSASFMNVPRSFETTLKALRDAGYDTHGETEDSLIRSLQRLLAPFYRDGELAGLLRDGLAERLPVATYRAWLQGQPPAIRDEIQERWGNPEKSAMVIVDRGEAVFVMPRLAVGKVIFSPQAPRGERWEEKEKALYHSSKAAPSHFYLAHYLWLREHFKADALVHYGTHGSQEWLPGKERGLPVTDYPMLAVGDVPVIYPYIVDNIGEALQAKRRGRAVIVTHQTPPFAPAGLHDALTQIHDLLHQWLAQDDGAVKDKLALDLKKRVRKERIERDMGWSEARIDADFRAFIDELHNHLHELAQTAQPLGLHTFGTPPQEKHRLGTVLLMLGKGFHETAARIMGVKEDDLDEIFVGDYAKLTGTPPFRMLADAISDKTPLPADKALAEKLEQGRRWYADLGAQGEIAGLLSALAGQHRPTSYGGDPIKNPDALPTGRNLYGFDPSRVPTKQAWEAGKEAADALIAAQAAKTGRAPRKLAFSLWSVETMRHQGILEAQALWTMGVEPVWDAGGRVIDVRLVPREQLKRPRVDVVLSATGLYRDHFPNAMKQLAKAVELAARANEADNPVYANSRAIAERLVRQGVPDKAAQRAAETRIFSNESGRYGTGLDDAALATDTWKSKGEADRKLAGLYLSRMQHAYGTDESAWGSKGIAGGEAAGAKVNLYAEHLKGTEGAVLSRTSNLYGMLTTDDPFQYLGGIGAAVRALDGKAPELYITNLRHSGGDGKGGKIEGADQFLAKELATRNFHPGYIQGLMAEGYAGTLQVLDGINNFTGWTTVAREIVRDDQWQEFVDVYVRDKHKLGLKDWFEKNNPHALAQSIEKMLEMARHGYWQADAKTVAELKQRYRELARRYDVKSDNATFEKFAAEGFGLVAPLPAPSPTRPQSAADLVAPPPPPAPPQITGMKLEKVDKRPLEAPPLALAGGGLLLLATAGGALSAVRRQRRAA
ncbi:cobaltochelatase subunit CobN [uncultured Dechloromonas sp.]|uniref:cobaltochelatase subunit CobN n=1 Tax=uncultured Dechloromonas sp. TaxID=171719 RepID=UPI0025F023C0|nr:cobaltochelatase subunit CobN [uncultured Dechloromonas sp.]